MLPIVEVPETVRAQLESYRSIFCKKEGFESISRYLSGLIISPNKTLQGIYDLQVWDKSRSSRRAMHNAVFLSGWSNDALMKRHREVVSKDHKGSRGKEVISIDWTLSHHEKGNKIYGVSKGYDYVKKMYCNFQTVLTATIANNNFIDGIDLVIQEPSTVKQEKAYLKMTSMKEYTQMEEITNRLSELFHYIKHLKGYKKRTEIAVEIAKKIEVEGNFPLANYAFDNGVLNLDLAQFIESCGKHWVSEIEVSRNIMWYGIYQRVDFIAEKLKIEHPESFRYIKVKLRNGEEKEYWAFTKVIRLKRYGRKRLVIVHEEKDLSDKPRFLLTDARHWESKRIIETWSYRWACEIFHEFGKQVTGLEKAQVRNEEAVKRHFSLSCISQSLIQRASCEASKSEKFQFANGQITFGQKYRTIVREILLSTLKLAERLFKDGRSSNQVLEVLMAA